MNEKTISSVVGARIRRVLAVLECRQSDEEVCARAVQLLEEKGGFLTIVAIAPRRFPWANAGPHCTSHISDDELRRYAETALVSAAALIPAGIALVMATEEGKKSDVIRRRVQITAPDVVVLRRCRRRPAEQAVPVVTC